LYTLQTLVSFAFSFINTDWDTMKYKFALRTSATAIGIICINLPAQAGGLYVGEFGQPNQGASRAGANAIAEDASTAFQNPAGVMFLDESKTMATGIIIHSKAKFNQSETYPTTATAVANGAGTGSASDGGDGGSTAVGGAFFHARPVNDKWGWTFAFNSVSGAALDYDNGSDFAGRYWASKVDLLTAGATPAISYKLSDSFSVSIQTTLTYGQLDMDVYAPGPNQPPAPGSADLGEIKIEDGDDTDISFGASAMWQATKSLRLGMLYSSETTLNFDSDIDLSDLPVPPSTMAADVEVTWPQTLRVSAAQDLNDEVTLLASIAWEDWSAFDSIPITTDAGTNALPRNWDDTYHFAVGLRWQQSARWTYYTGIAYDTDPTKASDRTADMPIDDQIRISGGVTYERDNGHKIGGVLTIADYGDADIDNGGTRADTSDWTVKGDYDTNRLIFLGLNYGW
jgi:long-chain fatty acid transport protein